MTTPSITDEQLKLWYTQRIDPPLPAHWGMPDEVSEFVGEVLWGTLFTGDSDPFSYVDILNDSTIAESDKWDCDEKHMEEFDDYARALIASRRAYAQELGIEKCWGNISLAFKELNRQGVVAREAFSCCSRCGSWSIYDEADDSRDWYGYVFFSEQSAADISETASVYLQHGIFPPALRQQYSEQQWESMSQEERSAAHHRVTEQFLQERVIPVLERHGLQVRWGGDTTYCPNVMNIKYIAIP